MGGYYSRMGLYHISMFPDENRQINRITKSIKNAILGTANSGGRSLQYYLDERHKKIYDRVIDQLKQEFRGITIYYFIQMDKIVIQISWERIQ